MIQPNSRLAQVATVLLDLHEKYSNKPKKPPKRPIRVVCISDTHNTQPALPDGDILIHAGDLTQDGSFDEYQAGLDWLSSQPHRFKFLIAGNHDVLLDDVFMGDAYLDTYRPSLYGGETRTRHDLNWGSVEYLHDEWTTIDIPLAIVPPPEKKPSNDDAASPRVSQPPLAPPPSKLVVPSRKMTIFGSPMTPKYGIWAFQYGPEEGEKHWTSKVGNMARAFQARNHYHIPTNSGEDDDDDDEETIILITHGPPKLYLDRRNISWHTGCEYLLDAVYKLRPRLHVFGHIHAGHGIQRDVVLDRVRQAHDDVRIGWGGIRTILLMVFFMFWERLLRVYAGRIHGKRGRDRATTFVNAAMVGGRYNQYKNEATVVEI